MGPNLYPIREYPIPGKESQADFINRALRGSGCMVRCDAQSYLGFRDIGVSLRFTNLYLSARRLNLVDKSRDFQLLDIVLVLQGLNLDVFLLS